MTIAVRPMRIVTGCGFGPERTSDSKCLPKLAKAFAGNAQPEPCKKTLCASRDTLRIPVFVGGKPLPCLEPLAAATESETFGTLVHNFLKADTVVDGFAYQFRNSNVTTARFGRAGSSSNSRE